MTDTLALPRDEGRTRYTRSNPLARIAGASAVGLVNVVTLDPVTPLLTLGLVAMALPLSGLSARQVWRGSWPLALAAATLAVVNTLAHPSPGLGSTDVEAGVTTALRLLAVALPGLLALLTIDPVDLADALVQQLRLPPRFAYGALAALRLLPLLAADWHTQGLAARARGVAPRGPAGRVRFAVQRVLGLLVGAVRRATRLAVALDARGFDAADRTSSRPSAWTSSDTGWTLAGAAAAGVVVAGSVALGGWAPFGW